MKNRLLSQILLVCYIGAVASAILAAFAFSWHDRWESWALALGAIALLIAAGLVVTLERYMDDLIGRGQSQLEVLRAQIAEMQDSVDVLADGLDAAIFICDPRATILYANGRAAEMFRFDHPEGRSFLAVTLSHEVEELIFEAFREQRTIVEERLLTNPVERVGICKIWPQKDGKRVFVSIYEITDLRRLERVRQDFVSNVSHELRTPLTIIRTMAETLLDEDTATAELRDRYLTKIVDEVDRLSAISADLLTLSVAESNPVKKGACDIAGTFRTTLSQLTEKAHEKGMTLQYDGPEHLVIEANTNQMTQVALNLLENALNYTIEGTVTVQVRQGMETAEIEITDTGIGIASEHLPRIFERFYRADRGRSRATGGTGLGLSIVKHIVEAHGGRVAVESSLNHGSRFTLFLPVGNPRRDETPAN